MISAVKKILLLLLPLFIFSCGMTVEESSFTAKLDTVDKLIFQSQFNDAQKILKSIENKSYSAFQFIAIAKRYINMKNFESAEKILTKATKKHPQNNEVKTVFAWVLLQQQKFDEACEVSEKLKETAYSGLYAESKFKQYSQLNQSFLQENFQLEYLYAYNATDSVKFLQNASIYECYNGNYEKAFSYHPIKMTQYSNPEFWAYVSYDSGNYIQAINDAKLMSNKKSVESSIIIADSYLKMRETKLAKQMWDKVISLNPNSDPSVLMNCAFSCLESGKIDDAFEYVKTLVSAFPDYINGLVLYGKFLLHYASL
ncbi:MAG: tetratricopeptide repeat protein, partial [Spirochaetaceae bacterium]|nr:tetratricopeptide repeat protein [Spirochaetaceae bacterium]